MWPTLTHHPAGRRRAEPGPACPQPWATPPSPLHLSGDPLSRPARHPLRGSGRPQPSMPIRAHPGRCHRCARRSPESAPGVGGSVASGGVTGARESQWHVGIAPPLPPDWPVPESRGCSLGRRATVELSFGRRCCGVPCSPPVLAPAGSAAAPATAMAQ